MAKLLIWQLAIEDYIVAVIYMASGDCARAVYWFAAGTCTLSTLFIGR